jgi:hypothetical protein
LITGLPHNGSPVFFIIFNCVLERECPSKPDSPYCGGRLSPFEFIAAKGERGVSAEDLRWVGSRDERRERAGGWRGSQTPALPTGLERG